MRAPAGFISMTTELLRAYDALRLPDRKNFQELPDPADVRRAIAAAESVAAQSNNPFFDFDLMDLWAITLASAFLAWQADPGNPQRWYECFDAREWLRDG
jgi:hypothetical protein